MTENNPFSGKEIKKLFEDEFVSTAGLNTVQPDKVGKHGCSTR